MVRDENKFKTIEDFINYMKENPHVIGIMEYGGRTYKDMSKGGDYDLTIIFDKPVSKNVSGVHFHIQGVPIDCMLLSIDDFLVDQIEDDFMLVHTNATILFDRNHILDDIVKRIRESWLPSKELDDAEISLFRYSFKHILDKLKYRLHEDELYSKYYIFANFDYLLICYARIMGWEVGKSKKHLKIIKETDFKLYDLIFHLYNETDLEKQYEYLSLCASYMLQSIGGLWRDDEVLFHLKTKGIMDKKEELKIMNEIVK